MAAADPSDRRQQGPAAPARRPRTRRPLATVAILLGLAVNLALTLRRVRDDRAALAFVAFTHLSLLLLLGALARFELAPPGSVARNRARLAVWVQTTTLTAVFAWKFGEMMPLGMAIAAWIMAAAAAVGGFYMMFLHGDK